MGNRLSKIYTRTGDAGTTRLGDGRRVDKDDPRVETYGTVDELNSLIGVVLSRELPAPVRDTLVEVQHDLFDLGGELCIPGYELITDGHVERLEQRLDGFNADLPALQEFILPGGGPGAPPPPGPPPGPPACHLARTVCRRAERRLVQLARHEPVSPRAEAYLNRLSDLLFVIARGLAHHEGGGDVLWRHRRRPDEGG